MKNEKNGSHAASGEPSHKTKAHEAKAPSKAPKAPSNAQGGELARLLESVGEASKRLNDAASLATRRIEAVEDELLAAEPGISVWGEPVLTELASFTRADGTLGVGQRVVTLGFDKVKKDKWGIAVRQQLKSNGGAFEEDVTLLRKADRGLRLLALPHLEGLVRQILTALEAQVRLVESAPRAEGAEGRGEGDVAEGPDDAPSASNAD